MKKFIIAAATLTLMGLGLGAATAAPYPATVGTDTTTTTPNVQKGDRVKTTVKVTTQQAGNGRPTGEVVIKWVKVGDSLSYSDTFVYDGGQETYRGPEMTRTGKWKSTVFYRGGDTVFKNSDDSDAYRVTR